MSRPANVLILAAALFIGAGPYLVRAAGHAPDGPITANIDLLKVYGESDARRNAYTRADVFARLMDKRYDDLNGVPYLTTAEIKDFAGASAAEKPTDADTQKIAALKTESAKRAEDYQLLSSKKEADITPAERTRLRDLNVMIQQRPQIMEGVHHLFQDLVNAELE